MPKTIEESIIEDEAKVLEESKPIEKEIDIAPIEAKKEEKAPEIVDKQPEVKTELDKKPETDSAWGRLRTKAKEGEKASKLVQEQEERIRQLQDENSKLKTPRQERGEVPNPEDKEAYNAYVINQLTEQNKQLQAGLENIHIDKRYSEAEQQLKGLESEFKSATPDYDDAIAFMWKSERARTKIFNPKSNDYTIDKLLKKTFIDAASSFYMQGMNPAEAMYALAQDGYGYAPKQQEESKEERKLPNLEVIDKNKKKTQTIMTKGKSGGNKHSAENIINMPLHEIEQLSEAELAAALDS